MMCFVKVYKKDKESVNCWLFVQGEVLEIKDKEKIEKKNIVEKELRRARRSKKK